MRSKAFLRHLLLVSSLLQAFLVGGLAGARDLTLAERVQAQKAVEEIYWRHRIWPKENPERKPAFEVAVPAPTIRAKVEDALAKSAALEQVWNRAIGHDQLQAELDRIVRDTRDAGLLREIFAALHDDPELIAETLARSTLADRLVRQWYARDGRLHATARAAADHARASADDVASMARNGLRGVTRTWHREAGRSMDGALDRDDWNALEKSLEHIPTGALGPVREEDDRFVVTAVLGRGSDDVTTVSFSWPKRSFDAWWKATRSSIDLRRPEPTGVFTIDALPTAACTADTWSPTMTTAPDARQFHTAVWTGTEMILWGGEHSSAFQTGARYSPATDTWTPTGIDSNTPTPRGSHAAVWTGTEMIVWGGVGQYFPAVSTGGRYNPATDQWAPTSNVNAPSARVNHSMIWTGSIAVVWGGTEGGSASLATGARYDPATDTWSPTSTGTNTPAARRGHTALWTGSKMIVWGGGTCCAFLNSGGIYDPSTNAWMVTSVGANVPAPRSRHVAVWTGTEMIVWGGGSYLASGGRYDPVSNTWSATSMGVGVPGPRDNASAVWTGSLMIVWGGFAPSAGGNLNSGGRYDPATDSWLPTRADASAPERRRYHTAIWDGAEMIMWGGHSSSGGRDDGARYDPLTDTWVPTGLGSAPTGRGFHVAVWTGTEMVVWGGNNGDGYVTNTGGRYDSALDAWSPTSLGDGVPTPMRNSTAVWTGREMMVWGGTDNSGVVTNAGGMYDPVANTWSPTPNVATTPVARQVHTAVWTGREMIVWGGMLADGTSTGTGAGLDPRTGVWRPVGTGPNAPAPRHDHVAVFADGRMVIWGGGFDTGGRYDPQTDSWTPTSHGGDVPVPMNYSAAVSTGPGMIVWGGGAGSSAETNIGWRYDVASDTWNATSLGATAPEGRYYHTLVWTGDEMLLWGGRGNNGLLNTGKHYDPTTDVWTELSVTTRTPFPRRYQTAVWTGTQMLVWGGEPATSSGGLYCACPNGALFYRDADGDGFGVAVATPSCDGVMPPGYVADGTDCNDVASSAHPGGVEVCDGIDDDCNGLVDEGPSGVDADGDLVAGLCDNCPLSFNARQSDFDHDSEGDACDVNDGLIFEWRADKSSVSWQEEQGPTSWNVYFGDLDALKLTGVYTQIPGSNALASRQCSVTTTMVEDLAVPEVGKASFSLVTGVTAGVEGPLGSGSTGPRPNQNPCP